MKKKNIVPNRDSDPLNLQGDIFGNSDGLLKFKLEGHDRGVSWVAFHPTNPLLVSGADDRQVKIWRYSDTKAWEVDTLRGHYNNISCCIFSPHTDIIISNGEDKSIRIWDISKRSMLHTYRREHERFWFVTAHPTRSIFAAAHDKGIIVFKLRKERPPSFPLYNNEGVVYIKDNYIKFSDFQSQDMVITQFKRRGEIQSLQYNQYAKALIIHYISKQFEVYDLSNRSDAPVMKGTAQAVCWVTRNRFVIKEKRELIVKGLNNETNTIQLNDDVSQIYPAQSGCLYMKRGENLILYDLQMTREIAEMICPDNLKFIIRRSDDQDSESALLSKDTVTIVNSKLEVVFSSPKERSKIKSGAWNGSGAFIYSTLSHIKYVLKNGDHGVVRTLDQPIYLVGSIGNRISLFTRDGQLRNVSIDLTELLFKQALMNQKFDEVFRIIKSSKLIGKSIIAYLREKGYPKIALHFVEDDRTKFDLAIECGNIDIALEAAKKLDDAQCWQVVAQEAMKQGNVKIMEMAYGKTKDLERLSFLHLITGNQKGLNMLHKTDRIGTDELMAQFHLSYYLGDVKTRVKMLEQSGQFALALLCARTYGFKDDEDRITRKLSSKDQSGLTPELIAQSIQNHGTPFAPLAPTCLTDENWPLLVSTKDPFDTFLTLEPSTTTSSKYQQAPIEDIDIGEGWADDINLGIESPRETVLEEPIVDEENEWDLDLDIDPSELPPPEQVVNVKQSIPLPNEGPSIPSVWCSNSNAPSDHIVAGSFDTAMDLLHDQMGICYFEPLKSHFLNLPVTSTGFFQGVPSTPSLSTYFARNRPNSLKDSLPQVYLKISTLVDSLQNAYRLTTAGKFAEALEKFVYILQTLSIVGLQSKQEKQEVQELKDICVAYITGIQTELTRKELQTTEGVTTRVAELAAYFTHCELQVSHQQLTLRSAMTIFFKLKNYANAYNFGRRLIALGIKQDVAVKIKQVMALCEQNGLKDTLKVEYDERNPFSICTYTYKPIYKGTSSVQCRYCKAQAVTSYKGKRCNVCKLGKLA